MTSNLLLVLGPLGGLFVARLFGPWRPLRALAAAAIGQFVVFYSYPYWQQYRMTHPTVGSGSSIRGVAQITPTLGGRLTAITALFMIAAMVAALALGAQALAARLSNDPPPAV
jgi:hypothetical protein